MRRAHRALRERRLEDDVDQGVLPAVLGGVVGRLDGALCAVEAAVEVGRWRGSATKAGEGWVGFSEDGIAALCHELAAQGDSVAAKSGPGRILSALQDNFGAGRPEQKDADVVGRKRGYGYIVDLL